MELGRPAHVAQAAGALLDRLEPELVAVEGARPLEVLSGELGDGMGVAERSGHGRLLGVIEGARTKLGDGEAGRSADVREDPAKGGGERVRIALLAEPAVVAREDHRLGPKSLRHGQRGAVGERAL